jgi:hypothetical protein
MQAAVSLVRAKTYRDARGRHVTELEGDFDAIPEHDRPPRFIVEHMAKARSEHFDDTPTRKPLRQRYPGRHISELERKHSGAVALLHNGPSLANHDLHAIKVPTIGMNRTHAGYVGAKGEGYNGPQPTYYCFVDHPWGGKETVLAHPRVINGSSMETDPSKGRAWRATKSYRMFPFSFDLSRDGYVSPVPCTTGFLALQLAVYMGFERIYLLGLDLTGGHFDGTNASTSMPQAVDHYVRCAAALRESPVKVFNCGSPDSLLKVFPSVPFSQLVSEA